MMKYGRLNKRNKSNKLNKPKVPARVALNWAGNFRVRRDKVDDDIRPKKAEKIDYHSKTLDDAIRASKMLGLDYGKYMAMKRRLDNGN